MLIVRTGSNSEGAALSHLTVGAASQRITDLEAAIGVELIERHSAARRLRQGRVGALDRQVVKASKIEADWRQEGRPPVNGPKQAMSPADAP